MEMAIGQFSSSGPVDVWNMVPLFRGVGYTAILGTFCAVTYYASLMSLALHYFFYSFRSVLPWTQCDTLWTHQALCTGGEFEFNQTNSSLAELYYQNKVFPEWTNIENGIGLPYSHLAICLLISWCIIYASLAHGIKYSGKMAYITSILPFCVLLLLAARGLTLSGARKGLEFLTNTDWAQLLRSKTWYAATAQVFFSLSTGAGPLTYLASKNKFKHNIYRDAVIISLMDSFASTLAAVTIFAVMGSLANELNVNVSDVVRSGPSMAFITYPHAVSKLDFMPQFFSALFFLALFTLGLGSANSMTGAVIAVLADIFPRSHRWLIALVVCATGFSIGLVYVTPGGRIVIDLVDYFGVGFVIYIAVLLEVVAVCYIYGLDNFSRDVQFMLGIKIGFCSKLSYMVMPLSLLLILVHIFTVEDQAIRNLPASALGAGWTLAIMSLILIPAFAIREVYITKPTTIIGKIKESLGPAEAWGPRARATRKIWMQYRGMRSPVDSNN